MKLINTFVTAVVLVSLCQSATAEPASTQVASSISLLYSRYEQMKDRSQSGSYEIDAARLSCLGQVFLKWSDAYLALISRTTDLEPKKMGDLAKFGGMYYRMKDLLPNFDTFAKGGGFTSGIAAAMAKTMSSANIPQLDPATMSLSNIQDQLYLQTYDQCLSEAFVSNAESTIKKIDPSAITSGGYITPKSYTSVWSCNASGGVQLERRSGLDTPVTVDGVCTAPTMNTGIVAGRIVTDAPSSEAVHEFATPKRPKDLGAFLDQMRNGY